MILIRFISFIHSNQSKTKIVSKIGRQTRPGKIRCDDNEFSLRYNSDTSQRSLSISIVRDPCKHNWTWLPQIDDTVLLRLAIMYGMVVRSHHNLYLATTLSRSHQICAVFSQPCGCWCDWAGPSLSLSLCVDRVCEIATPAVNVYSRFVATEFSWVLRRFLII